MHDYVKQNGKISECQSQSIFNSLIKGLKYVHDMNIFHRDLKPENLLMLNEREVVISDFGSAIRYTPGESEETTTVGSVAFQPPCTSATGKVPSGFKLDIWAVGVTLYDF